jgi:hypothetical protein
VTPRQSGSFTVAPGSEYKVEVWGGNSFFAKSSAVFRLDDGRD